MGTQSLEIDETVHIGNREILSAEVYDARERKDSDTVAVIMENYQREQRFGAEVSLFFMGRLALAQGQQLSICLYEPRYRMMIENAISDGTRRFGIVVDGRGICPGAKGRLASIAFHRERSDGSYDVVVEAGRSFTLSNEIWGVAPSTQSRVPPLLHTRIRVADANDSTASDIDSSSTASTSPTIPRRTLSSASSPSNSAQSSPTLSPRPLWVPAAKDVARKFFRAVRRQRAASS